MKKSFIFLNLILFAVLATSCSSAKTQPEPAYEPAPVVDQTTAPADLGASSSGRGL
jgi:PBP1b-binding outer membrane lipoprotein LpoB